MYYKGNRLGDSCLRLLNRSLKAMRLILKSIRSIYKPPIIVNASLSLNYDGSLIKSNWGDDINYSFLPEVIEGNVEMKSEVPLYKFLKLDTYLVIGSIIEMCSEPNCTIWGAGLIEGDSKDIPIPKKVLAVRGPRTRARLIEMGIECPEVYGDPALLIPLVYNPRIEKKYRLGIIAHYADEKYLKDILPESMVKGVKYIEVSNYDSWRSFVDEILECEAIASSSLHGLIVSEAYGVPSVWIEVKEPQGKRRSRFKYFDFYESILKFNQQPLIIDENSTINDIIIKTAEWEKGLINLQPLLACCPFPLKNMESL